MLNAEFGMLKTINANLGDTIMQSADFPHSAVRIPRSIRQSEFGIRHGPRCRAFSLVELLTVIFIIGLLIAILVPSISAARNSAKKATSRNTLRSIETGLEAFRNDNEKDFVQTNGYPPSFEHPPIGKYPFEPHEGDFPFLPDETAPVRGVYGAQWLPAMLLGVDNRGYVSRKSVPRADDLRDEPGRWYSNDPYQGEPGKILERQSLSLEAGDLNLIPTEKLPGRPPQDLTTFFPDWEKTKTLPVIGDSWNQPILYYVASRHGRETNMLAAERLAPGESYSGGEQQEGRPYYFHEDNAGFTGTEDQKGWDLAGGQQEHRIKRPGDELTADQLIELDNRDTFARYIIDRKLWLDLQHENVDPNTPLRPANKDTFILISPGPDGLYGTVDDVNNMPAWPDF